MYRIINADILHLLIFCSVFRRFCFIGSVSRLLFCIKLTEDLFDNPRGLKVQNQDLMTDLNELYFLKFPCKIQPVDEDGNF